MRPQRIKTLLEPSNVSARCSSYLAATKAFSIIRAAGSCLVVGMHPFGSQFSVPGRDFLQQKKRIGCVCGSTRVREHMPKIVDLFSNGWRDRSNRGS